MDVQIVHIVIPGGFSPHNLSTDRKRADRLISQKHGLFWRFFDMVSWQNRVGRYSVNERFSPENVQIIPDPLWSNLARGCETTAFLTETDRWSAAGQRVLGETLV